MNKYKFLEKARNIHGYKYGYIDIPEKLNYRDYIKLEIDNIIYRQRVNKHLEGKCPEKNTQKKTTEQFIKESKLIWGDRFDYSGSVYSGALKKIKIFDRYLGIFISQLPTLHLSGHECKNITNDVFIDTSKLVSDYKYSYDKCEYINKTSKVTLMCPDHGEFSVLPFNHLSYGEVCKKCKETTFNKNIKKFLNCNNISFYQEHRFIDCNFPFDFYLPKCRTTIEFYGIQHYEPITHFGGSESYNRLKVNDKIKSDYCEDNYIELIRIRYDQLDRVFDILKESLKNKIRY